MPGEALEMYQLSIQAPLYCRDKKTKAIKKTWPAQSPSVRNPLHGTASLEGGLAPAVQLLPPLTQAPRLRCMWPLWMRAGVWGNNPNPLLPITPSVSLVCLQVRGPPGKSEHTDEAAAVSQVCRITQLLAAYSPAAFASCWLVKT